MKKRLSILFLIVFLSGCSSNRYLLTDKGRDKKFLISYINDLEKKGMISKTPIIVVDGLPLRFNKELKEKRLSVSKNDIKQIEFLKHDSATKIYGESGKAGVLLITTKDIPDSKKSIDNSKVLYLLEDKEISQDELRSIDPKDVESIDVIKNKDKVKDFTSGDYDGVVIIHLKKQ